MKWGCALAGLMVGAMPATAWAQDQAAAPAPEATPAGGQQEGVDDLDVPVEEVVVSGRLEGAVPGDIKPEVQLAPAEIRSYGASNVGELIGQLSAELGTGQGRGGEQPVILLSGRRATMAEVRNLPPEAVQRVDILPEEVALKYGYSATQKVINIVLRRRFQSLVGEAEGRTPTAGGNAGGKARADLTMIRRDDRITLNLAYDQSSGILESERGVSRAAGSLFDAQGNIVGVDGAEIDPALSAAAGTPVTVAGVPAAAAGGAPVLADLAATAGRPNVTDVTPYRTLVNPQKKLEIDGGYSFALSPKIKASANVELEGTESEALLGLPGVTLRLPAGNPYSPFSTDVDLLRYVDGEPPLARSNSARRAEAGLTLNGDGTPWANSWNWSFQGNYRLNTSQSVTDNGVDPAVMQGLLDAGDPSFNPFGPIAPGVIRSRPFDTANSRSSVGRVDMLTNGPLFDLPAGAANASLRVAGQTLDFSSDAFRRGVASSADIARDSASARGNIDLPIASRRAGVLDAIGDFSLNANVEVEQLSDFGRLTAAGYGFNWSPVNEVRALVSWTHDSNAPSPQQLGNPLVITPNVRAFDYVRGESVDVTTITGGNPALRADNRNVFKAGLMIRPLSETNLTLTANYTNQRYRNTPGNLPGPTAEVEAAFPDRFVRDSDGRLLSIDNRPVNFASYDHSEVRWGFRLRLPIASPAATRMQERRTRFQEAMEESRRTGQPLPPEMAAQMEQFRRLGQQQSLFGGNARGGQGPRRAQGQEQGAAPQGPAQNAAPQGQSEPPRGQGAPAAEAAPRRFGPGGGFGGGGRGGFGGRGNRGNSVDFSLYHTWVLKDERVIRAGLPVLDYLGGAANGSSGGTPAHRIEVQTGIQRDGARLRLKGNWESGTQVSTGTLGSGDRLEFDSFATLDLQAQVDLGQQFDLLLKHPWLRGTTVKLSVDNLFDARRRVTDEAGRTPVAYQPNLLDPTGRVLRLGIRKMFF